MKNFLKNITAIILLISIISSFTACAFDESNYPPPPATIQLDIDGNQLEETILYEQILHEDILMENTLLEYKLEVTKLFEQNLPNNVKAEDIQVEVIMVDDIEGILDSHFSSDALMYDIDWGQVIGKFAIGTGIIIVTAVLSVTTSSIPGVGVVFATSCKEALKEATIGMAMGMATGALIGAIQNGGKISAMQKFAIEGMADGFMWGAISGALLGGYKGYSNYHTNSKMIYNGTKLVGKVKGLDIVDDAGKVTGKITSNGFAVKTTGEIIGKLDKAGNIIKNWKSLIPSSKQIIGTTGKVKYTIRESKEVIDKFGKTMGTINDAGQIISKSGNLVGMIDDSGKLMNGLQKTINAGFKVDLSGKITNTTKIIDGITYFVDDANQIIGSLKQAINSSGKAVTYVMQKVNPNSVKVIGNIPKEGLSKVVGQIDDAGNLVADWNKHFKAERSKAVKLAWAQEKALVESTGRGTYDWTAEEIIELLTTGKVKSHQGHHINSALYSPELAGDPNNIRFYKSVEHLSSGHGGNYQNPTFGSMLNRAI